MARFKFPKLPKLRLYQQIIACFILVVLVPLLGVSFIIYNINQVALKKELVRFTEHTAEALYKDLATEMSWQQDAARMLNRYFLDSFAWRRDFQKSAQAVFQVSEPVEAIGLYDAQGRLLETAYRNYGHVSPELRLPEPLPPSAIQTQYQVLYANTGNARMNPYFLRTVVPAPSGVQFQGRPVAAVVYQKRFDYLRSLIRSASKTLYDAVYIVDDQGMILAGPTETVENKQHISDADYAFFKSLPAGVTREYSTTSQTVKGSQPVNPSEDNDDTPPLQKVFVKMPDISWGILIESPYHVRQKYIKRARNQSLLLIIACLLVVTLLALFYILGISRNFRQLIKAIKAMAEGNYSRRIRLITNSTTPYEIIYLAGEFNRMGRKMAEAWQASQEANRKLAKLDEMKSNLIDTVSHELRTPLTNIKGYTSRLLRYDTTLEPETRIKSLKVIKQQADRLGRMVDDLLVIPDLEEANLRVFPDRVDLPEVIDRSVQFIQAREHRDIRVHLPTETPSILADPDRLEQIILNLLDNAIKYASDVEAPIAVAVTVVAGGVVLTVSNPSQPIPEGELETLFEKFKRLDESLTRTTRGSGLGLFITKGLVEAMGGRITLACRAGEFQASVELPLYREAEALATNPPLLHR